jgi:hypothetical protein
MKPQFSIIITNRPLSVPALEAASSSGIHFYSPSPSIVRSQHPVDVVVKAKASLNVRCDAQHSTAQHARLALH